MPWERLQLLVSVVLIAGLASACTTRLGDFSLLSTGTPQYATMPEAPIVRTVKASDGRLWFLFIPLGSAPNLEEAVDRAMDLGNGDFLERVRLYSTVWSIGLFSYSSYTVKGDVGNSRGGVSASRY